jgi:hypothetical protein
MYDESAVLSLEGKTAQSNTDGGQIKLGFFYPYFGDVDIGPTRQWPSR